MTEEEWQAQVTMEGEPASKARPRLGKGGNVYTPRRTVTAEEAWRWRLREVASAPIADRAFAVTLRFYSGLWTRKDIDNMIKLVLDASNGVVWADDRQVVGIDAWLVRGAAQPRTELTLRTVDQPLAPMVECAHCGKSVPSRVNRQRDGTDKRTRFCSSSCSWASKRGERLCVNCGAAFTVPASSDQRYCSRKCAGTAGGGSSTVGPDQLRRAVDLMAAGVSQQRAADAVGVSSGALARAIVAAGRRR